MSTTPRPESDLSGQVVIVTGAGNGLGRAHAIGLASAGACVVVNDLGGDTSGGDADHSAADDVVAEIRSAGGQAVASYEGVGDAEAASAIVQTALDEWGRLDAVVNNAGILRDRTVPKLSPEDIESVLRVHLFGSIYVSQAAFGHMKDNGHGRLVHTTSGAGMFGAFGQLNYAAAKAGIIGMSRSLALEGARYGITSNCIAPLARTRLSGDVFGPLNERLTPEAVTPLVVFLASRHAQVTGEVFSSGGGRFARMFSAFTPGWSAPDAEKPVDPHEIPAHMDEIMDDSIYTIASSGADEVMQLFTLWSA